MTLSLVVGAVQSSNSVSLSYACRYSCGRSGSGKSATVRKDRIVFGNLVYAANRRDGDNFSMTFESKSGTAYTKTISMETPTSANAIATLVATEINNWSVSSYFKICFDLSDITCSTIPQLQGRHQL